MTYGELISKATPEQIMEIKDRIIKIIGTKEQAMGCTRDLSEKINKAHQWQKQYERLAKVFLEHGEEALSMHFCQFGNTYQGVTVSGKKWTLERNWGFTDRSNHCGSLWIEGEGTVFTSGRLDKVFDYILSV